MVNLQSSFPGERPFPASAMKTNRRGLTLSFCVASFCVASLCGASLRGALALAVIAGVTVPASSQQPTRPDRDSVRIACGADRQTFRANAPPGGEDALACLKKHESAVSSACRAQLDQLPTETQIVAMRSSCRMDYISNCLNVPTGGGEALQCPREHESRISSGCRDALARRQAEAPPTIPVTIIRARSFEVDFNLERESLSQINSQRVIAST
jgi:hypothetical protein